MKLKFSGAFLAVFGILTLSGCGGGSGSDANTKNDQPDVMKQPTPSQIILPSVSLKAIKTNACSNEPIIADVVYHTVDGNFISSDKTLIDGKLNSTLPENTQHISLLYHSTDNNGKKYLQIQTLLNVQAGFTVDSLSFENKSNCACNSIKYQLASLKAEAPDSTIFNIGATPMLLKDAENTHSSCVIEKKKLIFTQSKSAHIGTLIDTSEQATVELTAAQFTEHGTLLDLSGLDIQARGVISLSSYIGNDEVHATVVNNAAYNHPSYQEQNQLVIYNGLNTTSYLSISQTGSSLDFSEDVSTHSYVLTSVDNTGKVENVQPINEDGSLTSAYKGLSDSFGDPNNNHTAVLDFSAIDPRVNMATLTYTWENDLQGEVSWQIITDGQETIPLFTYGDIYQAVEPENLSIKLTLTALNSEQEFNDLRSAYLSSLESFEKRAESKLFDTFASYSISRRH
ncbi:hypothetical protein [Pseudoalteromonas luteoviolacea]|uniref:Lipoprotein n=1 Tax=Pseudoalteromonas luteoviolacea (strain 2ta16) TaxID=1353533 RepID=V4HTK0_PSEL2|nr:hypothetical protein [Pseudoalteromonas luteoviolacea]ESP94155.1 hypothetical protein PL2TA16_02405 [Pseudoalteromonas luteoviolacea 2ta16]KZN38800.1 hypothetical protein N483_00085 [Pseudoalteromonas luteoviolacea NCIMB 1944]